MDNNANPHFDRMKSFLESAPHDGWIFGVCATLARRTGWDLWAVRLIAVISALVFTLATALVYFVLSMLLQETRPGAQRKISRWARKLDAILERIWRGLKQFFAEKPRCHRDTDGRYETNGEFSRSK